MTTAELVEHLRAQVMALPERERLQLVMSVSASLGPSDDEIDVDEHLSDEWVAELRRRAANVRAGSVGIPADEAFAAARAALRRR